MDTETPSMFGVGVNVACTCGQGNDDGFGHSLNCRGSAAIREQIANAMSFGIVGGTLTRAEEKLLEAVTYLIKDRCGELGGEDHDIDLGELGRDMIRDAADEICALPIDEDGPDPDYLEAAYEVERRGLEDEGAEAETGVLESDEPAARDSVRTESAFDRTTVLDALDLVSSYVRDGLPLITWEVQPSPGQIRIDGHASGITRHGTPQQVTDTVRAYAERFGVEPEIRRGEVQDELIAKTTVVGIPVRVWGVVARHEADLTPSTT